jgi:hypothetical protein
MSLCNSGWQPVKLNNFKTNVAVGCPILWLYVHVLSDANLGQATVCQDWVLHHLLQAMQEYYTRIWNKTTVSFFHVTSNSWFISEIMIQRSILRASWKRRIIKKNAKWVLKNKALNFRNVAWSALFLVIWKINMW